MSKGFDCASPLKDSVIQQFVSDGFVFVCRYLSPEGSWKRLTADEAKIITNHGMYIVSVFERGSQNSLGGTSQGCEDGSLAYQFAQEVLQPEGTVIYAAVDTDVNSSQFDVIEQYLRAFAQKIPGYEVGIYGEKDICDEMRNRGVVNRVWQTKAWSHGEVLDGFNLYQNDLGSNGLGIELHGITVDLDESNGDSGGWQVGMVINSNKEEDIVEFSHDYQWDVLKQILQNAYDKSTKGEIKPSVLSDYGWCQAAYDENMKSDDLAWLAITLWAKKEELI